MEKRSLDFRYRVQESIDKLREPVTGTPDSWSRPTPLWWRSDLTAARIGSPPGCGEIIKN